MSSALEDEITSIDAIYGEQTLQVDDAAKAIYTLRLPLVGLSLRVSFPVDYPDEAPSILGPGSTGSDLKKGEATEIAALAQDVLQRVFRPGEPCVYDLLEELGSLLPGTDDADRASGAESEQEADGAENAISEHAETAANVEPSWTLSDVVTEKKSVFIARAAHVSTPAEAKHFVAHLLATDKRAAKATHNITAWRIQGSGTAGGGRADGTAQAKHTADVVFQDCDDDGETAAGGRLLHLLQMKQIWNVVVVVTRWYGGIHLGPDRFRIINSVASDALAKGGFSQ